MTTSVKLTEKTCGQCGARWPEVHERDTCPVCAAPVLLAAEVEPVVTMVPDHTTGEIVDLREADDGRLVDYIGDGAELIEKVKRHQDAARGELRRRMDQAAKWSRRIGDPKGVQFEISCPSPDAGTETFLADELLDVLRDLVGDDVITAEAAEGAIKRTLTITLGIPLDVHGEAVADALRSSDQRFEVAGAVLTLQKVDTDAKTHLPGVKTLRKIRAARPVLDAIAREAKPTRTVRIKRIERGA